MSTGIALIFRQRKNNVLVEHVPSSCGEFDDEVNTINVTCNRNVLDNSIPLLACNVSSSHEQLLKV